MGTRAQGLGCNVKNFAPLRTVSIRFSGNFFCVPSQHKVMHTAAHHRHKWVQNAMQPFESSGWSRPRPQLSNSMGSKATLYSLSTRHYRCVEILSKSPKTPIHNLSAVRVLVCAHTYIYIHTRKCTHVHAYTHTHAHTGRGGGSILWSALSGWC